MKKPDPTQPIDADAEVLAIAEYLAPRWDGIEGDLKPVVRRIHAEAKRLARGWFASTTVFFPLAEQVKLRRSVLELSLKSTREREIGPDYDCVSRQLTSMLLGLDRLRDAALSMETEGLWDYERQARRVAGDVQRAFPWTTDIKPNGWEQMRRDYSDYQGMNDWDAKTSRAEFEGHEFAVRAPDLVSATALPNVMYDDVNQGRSAAYTFVSAIFSHCLSLTEHNNTVGMLQELEALQLDELPCEVLFAHPLKWEHPIWIAMHKALRVIERDQNANLTAEAYATQLKAERQPVSPEQRKVIADKLISEILAEGKDGEAERRRAHEMRINLACLRGCPWLQRLRRRCARPHILIPPAPILRLRFRCHTAVLPPVSPSSHIWYIRRPPWGCEAPCFGSKEQPTRKDGLCAPF